MEKYFATNIHRDEYGTPQQLFDDLNERFHFTVDVAASEVNHKCKRYYTKEQDGLSKNWDGETVWCNPPYGRDMWKWIKKGYDSKNSTVVFLVPARTGTSWFHNYVYGKHEVIFLRGRLKFEGSVKTTAPFDCLLIIMKNK